MSILLATPPADAADWLGSTTLIDSENANIRTVAETVTKAKTSPRDRAVALHDFVRDRIAFGFTPSFYDMKASEVLAAGVGYCNTKGTLFVALLRAAGIPARQHFVDIDANILRGVINPGTPFVDHSYVEVLLDGRWLKVDSYIVDPPLFTAAQRLLARDGSAMGYGVHRAGTYQWDGTGDAFSQFVPGIGTRNDWGVRADVTDFYANTANAWNRKSLLVSLVLRFSTGSANSGLDDLRQSSK